VLELRVRVLVDAALCRFCRVLLDELPLGFLRRVRVVALDEDDELEDEDEALAVGLGLGFLRRVRVVVLELDDELEELDDDALAVGLGFLRRVRVVVVLELDDALLAAAALGLLPGTL
jgi:hypothetical protein